MFKTVSEFLEDRLAEERLTLAVIKAGNSESILAIRPAPGAFSFAELGWHISQALFKIGEQVGLIVPDMAKPELPTASMLAKEYLLRSEMFRKEIERKLTDQTLGEIRPVYGFDWTVGYTLNVIMKHEVHHRAQMVTLLHLGGIKPPKIYG